MKHTRHALLAVLLLSGPAQAIDPFVPLTAPAIVGGTDEATSPFLLPAGWTQSKVTDRNTLNGPGFFSGSYPSSFRFWDMIAVDQANPNLLYFTHEFPFGAGLTRYDRGSDTATILLQGNFTASFQTNPSGWSHLSDDFGTLDPAVTTPWGTLVTAEEGGGRGRLFELANPASATGTGDAQWSWRSNIPSVAHEGLKFDPAGNLYFVDENLSGSIYKFTPTTPGDLSQGQTFVLDVAAFGGLASEAWNSLANAGQLRTGAAIWDPLTDANGNAITAADPFDFNNRGGRLAADEVGGTPFGRPEDLELKILGNGNIGLFFAATDEHIVYSVELDPNGSDAIVREFVNALTTGDTIGNDPVGLGIPGSNYGFANPDNLAIDADGDIFIVEDDLPGDIWLAEDLDNDGVAESLSLFASLGVAGTEPSGLIFDPQGGFLVDVMHPSSGNDALWSLRPVPLPAAAWLFAAALASLLAQHRRSPAASA